MRFSTAGLKPALRFKAAQSPRRSFAPLRLVDQSDHKQTHATLEWIDCPCCGKTFVGAAIVNDPPTCDVAAAFGSKFAVCRTLYCDHCNILVKWMQPSNIDGSKLGPIPDDAGPPAIVKGDYAINKFLAKHPEAAGVLQS